MATITVSRQFASEGAEIAHALASTLGYHLVDRDGLRTVCDQYGVLEFDDVYDARRRPGGRLARRSDVNQLVFQIVRAVAKHGDSVILGRGGYAALRGLDDVLNVRVQAPLAVRAERAVAEHLVPAGEDPESAVRAADARRIAFVDSCGARWDSTEYFDLVLDTGKISTALAVSMLAEVVRSLPGSPARTGRRARDLEIDEVLEAAVADLLRCHASHDAARSGAEAQPPG